MRPSTRHLSLALIPLAFLLAGCGGGSDSAKSGRAEFRILWPAEETRLIPAASNSIKVEIRRGGTVIATKLSPKPAGGGSALVVFDNLPVAQVTATATAYPNADGTGTAQATGSVTFQVQAGQTTPFSITMASTIDRLEVTPPTLTLNPNEEQTLSVAAKDSANNIVLLSPSKLEWRSNATSVATVDSAGRVTAQNPGSTEIRVTETESGKIASISVIVNAVAPGQLLVYEGFDYPAGSEIAGQSGGIGWLQVWGQHGVSTPSLMESRSLQFANLATTGKALRFTSTAPVGHVRWITNPLGTDGTVIYTSILIQPVDTLVVGGFNHYLGYGVGNVLISEAHRNGGVYWAVAEEGRRGQVISSVPMTAGVTAFLVTRITYRSGNDLVEVWINPVAGTAPPRPPDLIKEDADAGTVNFFALGAGVQAIVDEIRIGTTYAAVAPAVP